MSGVLPLQPPRDGLVGQTADGEPVNVRYEDRIAHVAVIGKSQFGKTTLVEHLILDDQRRDTGVIVLDAHGDLTQRLISAAPAAALERITLIEVNEERAFGLNLYECLSANSITVDRTVGNVVEVFKKLFLGEQGRFYPIIEEGLRNSAYVIIANGYTMAEVPLLFLDENFRRHAVRAVTNRSVLTYWEQYERSTAREQREKREPVLNKISRFLSSESIRLMVSQPRTTIPFQSVLDTGGTLIFRLAGDVLDRETVAFLGMVFLSVLSNVVLERAGLAVEQRRRVHVYLDEYGRFATKTTERMLEEFGKYQFGITVAHQNLVQLPSRRPPSAASLVLFQLDGDDAQELASQLDCTPRRTKRVPRRRTAPQYKEWDEEIWDSEAIRTEYHGMQARAKQIQSDIESVKHQVTRLKDVTERSRDYQIDATVGCHCGDHRLGWGHGIRSNNLVSNTLEGIPPTEDEDLHRLFNPRPEYFYDIMWHGRPAGTRLTQSGLTGLHRVEHRLPSRLGDGSQRDYNIYEGYRLLPEAAEHSWIMRAFRQDLSGDKDREWAGPLIAELTTLLKSLYKGQVFLLRLSAEEVDQLRWPPAIGTERRDPQWPAGHWTVRPFPQAVQWLVKKVEELKSEERQLHMAYLITNHVSKEFFKKHRSSKHHKEYLGEQSEEERVLTEEMRTMYLKGRIRDSKPHLHTRYIQWYDYVEELDQTHADRRGEIATELATLPRFVAYCKLLDATGTPHEYRVQTNLPVLGPGKPGAINSVRSRSRQHHATGKKTIEAQIEERQRSVAGPPPDDEPPTIGRRSPKR